jgi:hypothetical protein
MHGRRRNRQAGESPYGHAFVLAAVAVVCCAVAMGRHAEA